MASETARTWRTGTTGSARPYPSPIYDNDGTRDLAIGVPGYDADTGSLLVPHGVNGSQPALAASQHDFTTFLQEDDVTFSVQK